MHVFDINNQSNEVFTRTLVYIIMRITLVLLLDKKDVYSIHRFPLAYVLFYKCLNNQKRQSVFPS